MKEPTLLAGTEVTPWLLPGESAGRIRVRWMGWGAPENYTVVYAVDDGSGVLPPEPERAPVSVAYRDGVVNGEFYAFFEAELTVIPGERYLYGIAERGETPAVLYPFRAEREDGCFSAVLVSDTHLVNIPWCGVLEDTLEQALNRKLSEGEGLDAVIHLGDVLDKPGEMLSLLTRHVPLLRSLPLAAVPGNHDSALAVSAYFPMPHADRETGDYWFVRDGVLFLGMNVTYTYYAAHEAFFRSAAAVAPEHTWTVLLLHYSIHSNGHHGIDQKVFNIDYFLGKVFSELDVDLAVSGHDHEYDRTPLFNGDGPVPDSSGDRVEKARGEAVFVCCPSSTAIKVYSRNIDIDYTMAAEGLEKDRGYLLLDVTPEELRLRAVSADSAETVDDFILCHK